MSRDRPRFSGAAIRAGVIATAPIQVGLLPFALVCGVQAQAHGLSLLEAGLMSALVYAGSAQLLAFEHWGPVAPLVGAAFASFVVNLRLALMGPLLSPWLDRVQGWRLWGSLFVMADQNWALSLTEQRAGRWDAGYLFGSGVAMWTAWVVATVAGHVAGGALRLTPGHPLFFTALAVFVAILVPMWRGRRDVLPWAVAAGVAVLLHHLLPGTSWYVAGGALAGAAAGVLRDRGVRYAA